MKKFIFIFLLFCAPILCIKAQNRNSPDHFKQVEAAKIAFITKELSLTREEAERFFPLYNQYQKDMRILIHERKVKTRKNRDELDYDSEVLALKLRYRDTFIPILNAQRTARFFEAEREFRERLIKELQERRGGED